jgi:hypothetical protein
MPRFYLHGPQPINIPPNLRPDDPSAPPAEIGGPTSYDPDFQPGTEEMILDAMEYAQQANEAANARLEQQREYQRLAEGARRGDPGLEGATAADGVSGGGLSEQSASNNGDVSSSSASATDSGEDYYNYTNPETGAREHIIDIFARDPSESHLSPLQKGQFPSPLESFDSDESSLVASENLWSYEWFSGVGSYSDGAGTSGFVGPSADEDVNRVRATSRREPPPPSTPTRVVWRPPQTSASSPVSLDNSYARPGEQSNVPLPLTSDRQTITVTPFLDAAPALENVGVWAVLPFPNRVKWGPDSIASRSLLSTESVQGDIDHFYVLARLASADGSERPLSKGVFENASFVSENVLAYTIAGYHYSIVPDYDNGVLRITIDNVASLDSALAHFGIPTKLPTQIATNAFWPATQAFPYDQSTNVDSEVRPVIGLPFGNYAETYEIVIPLDYQRLQEP